MRRTKSTKKSFQKKSQFIKLGMSVWENKKKNKNSIKNLNSNNFENTEYITFYKKSNTDSKLLCLLSYSSYHLSVNIYNFYCSYWIWIAYFIHSYYLFILVCLLKRYNLQIESVWSYLHICRIRIALENFNWTLHQIHTCSISRCCKWMMVLLISWFVSRFFY